MLSKPLLKIVSLSFGLTCRKFCGLPGADTFEELFGSMSNETIARYSSIYESPADVDLWSGGVSERPLPGSMVGPTFACIIATQYSYTRRGDRFWFELPNQPSSFTPGEHKLF
jgi:peroxidase